MTDILVPQSTARKIRHLLMNAAHPTATWATVHLALTELENCPVAQALEPETADDIDGA